MGRKELRFGIGGLVASLGGTVMMSFAPSLYPEYAQFGFWAGVALTFVGVLLILWAVLQGRAEEQPVMGMGDRYNNFGKNFGHMGPVNNYIGKQPFVLTPDIVEKVVDFFPEGSTVTVFAVGSKRAFPMQRVIADALRAKGCEVELNSAGTFLPPPEQPITVDKETSMVIIAPDV